MPARPSTTPASPWIGSTITATTSGVSAARSASTWLNGAWAKPGTAGGKIRPKPGLPLAAIIASVRPWKLPPKLSTVLAPPLCRWPHLRASLTAASLASAPLVAMKQRSRPLRPARRWDSPMAWSL
jgi:hypothetical protein